MDFIKKVSAPTAKYFACYNSAYRYPFFKTHKLNNNQLLEVDILDKSRRFLQSAGDITTSRMTAFLEMIFKPINTIYCQFQLNEYCRDSKHYLMELEYWKSTQPTNPTFTLFINTADEKSLYPSVNQNLYSYSAKACLERVSIHSDVQCGSASRQTSFSGRGNAKIKLPFSGHIANKFQRPTILQLNIEGLTASKMNVLHQLAMQSEVLVILLQETHCTDTEKLVLPNNQLAGLL